MSAVKEGWLPATLEARRGMWNRFSLGAFRGSTAFLTPRYHTCSLWKCEGIHFHCFKPAGCGALFQWPQDTPGVETVLPRWAGMNGAVRHSFEEEDEAGPCSRRRYYFSPGERQLFHFLLVGVRRKQNSFSALSPALPSGKCREIGWGWGPHFSGLSIQISPSWTPCPTVPYGL